MENQVFYENYDKNSDLINKNDIRKFLFNSNLIRLESELNNKLEFDYHFNKTFECNKKKTFYSNQPKHTIDEILGIKSGTPRNKFDAHNDSDSDDMCNPSQNRSPDSHYKSGLLIFSTRPKSANLFLSFGHQSIWFK